MFRLSRFIHFLSSAVLILPGFLLGSSMYYFVGWGIFSFLLVYQHTLVKEDDLSKVNLAFFTTNGFASVIFLIFFLLDYFAWKIFWYSYVAWFACIVQRKLGSYEKIKVVLKFTLNTINIHLSICSRRSLKLQLVLKKCLN